MPKGYEDARSMTDLRARKQQLEELASGHVITSSQAPSSNHHQIVSKITQATLTRPTSSLPTTRRSPTSRKFSSTSVATISKEYYKKLREDPIRYERYLEDNRRYYARLRSGDNKTYRARLEQMAARSLKRHDEDPAFREHAKLRAKICYRKFAHRPAYRQRRFLRTLLLDYPWSRAGLPWKSHLPLVSAEPIERHCSGCDTTRTGGVKLWWRKIDAVEAKVESDSQNFLCHHCYIPADDWARAMPEGYEDVKSLKELVARKKQLDGSFAIGKYAKGEYGHRADVMNTWVRTHEWIRLLDWKTHQPVVSEQKIYNKCARCDHARHISLKLWWRSSTETICNACHAKADWSDSMPHG